MKTEKNKNTNKQTNERTGLLEHLHDGDENCVAPEAGHAEDAGKLARADEEGGTGGEPGHKRVGDY